MDERFGLLRLTADLPGIGGRIKEQPEDFLVEEVPLYPPAGHGSFCFLFIEKTNLSTLQLLDLLRRRLGLEDLEIGLAGWKDRRAVSRQWVSVPRRQVSEAVLEQLRQDGLKILRSGLHPHKLRTGHLLGNRFSVVVRRPAPEAERLSRAIIQRLQIEGLPNFYGPQRFGAGGDNAAQGLELLLGYRRLPRGRKRRLLLSATTSLLFNLTLKERLERGLLGRLLRGDIAKKHERGGLFLVSEPVAEQPRADRLEISPTGPIWGKKMMRPRHAAAALEEEILERQGLTPAAFQRLPGSRRPLRIPLGQVALHRQKEDLRLEFFLPKGSYATVLLDEIMKPESRGGQNL